MFGSGRPDGSAARARLRALTPRWLPTEAEISEATQVPAATSTVMASGPRINPDDAPARHALPEAPRASWRIDAAAARGLVSLALAAVAGALVMVILGWPRGVAEGQSSGGSGSRPATSILTEPSASTSEAVVVDVDGQVKRRGVVELPNGSRVIDAIKAAGGVTHRGDTGSLNLAEVLIDGQQIVVPSTDGGSVLEPGAVSGSSATATPAPTTGSTTTVSINSATATDLETLPGIGPVLAAAIVEWRTQNGGFTSIDQLQEVSGIGPTTYAELAPFVRL